MVAAAKFISGSLRTAVVVLILLQAGPALSAVVDLTDTSEPELSQRFLSERVSVLKKGAWRACDVHSRIDIEASEYHSPDGQPVAFTEIVRSVASGLSIYVVDGTPDAIWRLSLKYPISEVRLQLDERVIDLTGHVSPAGDTVEIPDFLKVDIQAVWQAQGLVIVDGHSWDTGNRVRDRLMPPQAEDLELCRQWQDGTLGDPEEIATRNDVGALWLTGLGRFASGIRERSLLDQGLAKPRSPRRNGPLGLSWSPGDPDAPPPEPAATCRIRDVEGILSRAVLDSVEGFQINTDEAWLRHSIAGELVQIYVPGLFDAVFDRGTTSWVADVSLAAISNDPREAPKVKGCLGTMAIRMRRDGNRLVEFLAPRDGDGGLIDLETLMTVAFDGKPEEVPDRFGDTPGFIGGWSSSGIPGRNRLPDRGFDFSSGGGRTTPHSAISGGGGLGFDLPSSGGMMGVGRGTDIDYNIGTVDLPGTLSLIMISVFLVGAVGRRAR